MKKFISSLSFLLWLALAVGLCAALGFAAHVHRLALDEIDRLREAEKSLKEDKSHMWKIMDEQMDRLVYIEKENGERLQREADAAREEYRTVFRITKAGMPAGKRGQFLRDHNDFILWSSGCEAGSDNHPGGKAKCERDRMIARTEALKKSAYYSKGLVLAGPPLYLSPSGRGPLSRRAKQQSLIARSKTMS
jgi:hypothetical protein